MKNDNDVFEWTQSGEDRVRYSGSIRGWDELGHYTFAAELSGKNYYGEIKKAWLSDGHSFNIEILSFGHHLEENVGMPMSPNSPLISKFREKDLEVVRLLICKMVESFSQSNNRPSVLDESENSRFMGKVIFVNGWALIDCIEEPRA